MQKQDLYNIVLNNLKATDVAEAYIGQADRISGDNLIYYSPLRPKERTPSFFISDTKGVHDFGIGEHYNIISFVAKLFNLDYWSATKKLIIDFQLDFRKVNIENIRGPTLKEKAKKINVLQGNKAEKIICYFDNMCYKVKPKNDVALIKNRIIDNSFRTYKDVKEIAIEILKGKTCIPSAIKGNADKNWRRQQVFLLDFDNKYEGIDLNESSTKYVTEKQILEYCKSIKLLPSIIYNTFSHTEKQHKFRLVFIFEEEITDIEIAKKIQMLLLDIFKSFNPDTSKKNLSDMYFGGKKVCYLANNFCKVEIEN